jgi:mono/diheme cytochrome c family protein
LVKRRAGTPPADQQADATPSPAHHQAPQFPRPADANQSLVASLRVDQADIETGALSFREIQEIGRHLFTQPFTNQDGWGEGPGGPRMRRLDQLRNTPGSAFEFFPNVRYLRIHGLDSQNCLECHNLTGVDQLTDTQTSALSARPDRVAGSGGISVNAMINPLLQANPPGWLLAEMRAQGHSPDHIAAFMYLRNPPHVMGAGYTQKLAQEMTVDLLYLRELVLQAAADDPGNWYEAQLTSKGVNFGIYAALKRANGGSSVEGVCGALPGFEEDCSGIEGVSHDFVVRPFQWKGIASNMRNFVRDALNFHFGMQPDEAFPGTSDADQDGVHNEVSVGEVTALTLFALSNRPPIQRTASNPLEATLLARGQQVFEQDAQCASCHKTNLRMESPWVGIHNPNNFRQELGERQESLRDGPTVVDDGIGLGVASPKDRPLPIDLLAAEARKAGASNEKAAQESLTTAVRELVGSYAFDLNMEDPSVDALPASYPRLPAYSDGQVDVPLFSDLKRHRMGACLADPFGQQVDREGLLVERDLYLTRPLWGVANTAPYMHDGRALSLREAILAHADDTCRAPQGNAGLAPSEANASVALFRRLSDQDQAALITFLKSLRIPVEPSLAFAVQGRP